MLSPSVYDELEQKSVAELPNRVLMMVQSVAFGTLGYPTRVRSESELWKYLDVMHESRFEHDLEHLLGGLTDREFELFKRVASFVLRFSEENFQRPLTTRSSLLRALNVYRHLTDLFGDHPARIFEIGPGSGYLGCLLLDNQWAYGATDVTQAFYLLQNHLWHGLSEGKVKELAENNDWDGSLLPGGAVHIPWWEFYRLLDRVVPKVDVVTCNHALAEMHPDSLVFTLRAAREMLRGEGLKAFVFEGWGCEQWVQRSLITKQFYRAGFRLVHNDDHITVFVPEENAFSRPAARLPSRFWWPGGKAEVLAAVRRIVGIQQGWIRFWPPRFASKRNQISRKILAGNQCRETERRVGIGTIEKFFAELLDDRDDEMSPDEKFLHRIGQYDRSSR